MSHPLLSFDEIKLRVTIAIGVFLKNDSFLLENDVNERSITHKLAEYIQQQFPQYHVDCEYNRMANGDKITESKSLFVPERQKKSTMNTSQNSSSQPKGNRSSVLPDIIIHKRGTKDKNLLIIEVKKAKCATTEINLEKEETLKTGCSRKTIKARTFDHIKIQAYMKESNDGLSYKYGLYLEFDRIGNIVGKSADFETSNQNYISLHPDESTGIRYEKKST